MSSTKIRNTIESSRIISIIRANGPDGILKAAETLAENGITAIEVTLNTPGALDVIREATEKLGKKAVFGAGTVLDETSARLAILAGAQFLVTPTLDEATIRCANRYGVPICCGAYSPTEALCALEAGAAYIKIFPAGQLGAKYIKDLRAPMPQLPLIPTGGVTQANTADFLNAGATAVAIGGGLVNQQILDEKNWAEIARRAQAFTQTLTEH